jgi:hypothetical protein
MALQTAENAFEKIASRCGVISPIWKRWGKQMHRCVDQMKNLVVILLIGHGRGVWSTLTSATSVRRSGTWIQSIAIQDCHFLSDIASSGVSVVVAMLVRVVENIEGILVTLDGPAKAQGMASEEGVTDQQLSTTSRRIRGAMGYFSWLKIHYPWVRK